MGGRTVKNLRSLPCKLELDQSGRRSSQAIASTRKSWPNGVANICDDLRARLALTLFRQELYFPDVEVGNHSATCDVIIFDVTRLF